MAGNDSGIPSAADVIVVGSGSGGAVVARRLVDAGATCHRRGRRAGRQPGHPRSAAAVRAVGQRAGLGLPDGAAGRLRGRELHWPRGKVLGGSSALNGMIYTRGHRSDYDAWAYLGNDGWGYDDVLPLFKRSEDFDRGASGLPRRGRAAARALALRAAPAQRGGRRRGAGGGDRLQRRPQRRELDGVAFCQLNVKDGVRQSTATRVSRAGARRAQPDRADAEPARSACSSRASAASASRSSATASSRRSAPSARSSSAAARSSRPSSCCSRASAPADGARRRSESTSSPICPASGATCTTTCSSPVIYGASRPVPPPLPGLQQLHSHLFWRSRPGLPGPDVQPLFFHLPLYLEGMEGPPDGYTLMAGIIRPAEPRVACDSPRPTRPLRR